MYESRFVCKTLEVVEGIILVTFIDLALHFASRCLRFLGRELGGELLLRSLVLLLGKFHVLCLCSRRSVDHGLKLCLQFRMGLELIGLDKVL